MKNIRTHEFIDNYAESRHISRNRADVVIRDLIAYLNEVLDDLATNESLTLNNFGSFRKVHRAEKVIGDVRNSGQRRVLPEKYTITFKRSETRPRRRREDMQTFFRDLYNYSPTHKAGKVTRREHVPYETLFYDD